jgi:hypothetical protein
MKKQNSLIGVLAIAGLTVMGCGGGNNNGNTADNPGKAGGSSSAQYNTYVGTQTADWPEGGVVGYIPPLYGGEWGLSFDDSSKFYSLQNVGRGSAAVLGSFAGSSFVSMTTNGSTTPGNGGYAVEISGQAAVVRPGNNTIAPVVAVETSNCLTVAKPTTYQFISLGTPDETDPIPHVAYGSLQAATSGVTWNFSNLEMYAFDGTDLKPTALPAGGCGLTAEGFAVTISPSAATNNLLTVAQVSPSGYFIMDQGQGEPVNFSFTATPPAATGPLGLVGAQQPSSQLTTSAVVAGQYLGFQFDAVLNTIGLAGTLPVAFGQTSAGQAAGTGTTMNGGAYPNDEITQNPAANITIDLGVQDSANNGLYKSVTVTVPDTYKACIQQPYGGTDANGNPTCIFQGEAVVGNPNGKYAIFVTVNDVSLQNRTNSIAQHLTKYAAMDFFLYQQ